MKGSVRHLLSGPVNDLRDLHGHANFAVSFGAVSRSVNRRSNGYPLEEVMAKKNEEMATIPVPQESQLVMSRPAFLNQNDSRGTEHLTKDDLKMPRIALAQQMSPQLDEGNAQFIEGLKQGDMFNSVTEEIIGKGPITFTVVRCDPPRYVEFNPREQGGGVKDPNVAPHDPRTQFGPNGEIPIATKFYDFIIARTDKPDLSWNERLVALSLKSTGLKVAKQLNTFMKLRNAPIFSGNYSLGVVKEENAKGKFYNFTVKNAGWIDEASYKQAEAAFEMLKDRVVVIDRENDHEGTSDSFDTSQM